MLYTSFARTPQRIAIIDELNRAEAAALRAAILLIDADAGESREDAHRCRGIAQAASARREVIEQRWSLADRREPDRSDTPAHS